MLDLTLLISASTFLRGHLCRFTSSSYNHRCPLFRVTTPSSSFVFPFHQTGFSTFLVLPVSRRSSVFQTKASEDASSAPDANELFNDLKEKWDALENKSTVILPKIFELVGLGYTGWFVYRYLLFKVNRLSCSVLFFLSFFPKGKFGNLLRALRRVLLASSMMAPETLHAFRLSSVPKCAAREKPFAGSLQHESRQMRTTVCPPTQDDDYNDDDDDDDDDGL
ncbi:hypothetical protein LXL04_027177 [Taraxacum kok-saghyz]